MYFSASKRDSKKIVLVTKIILRELDILRLSVGLARHIVYGKIRGKNKNICGPMKKQ
jgi:hypothetical protein